jgi:AraC-like DNA-binding protein
MSGTAALALVVVAAAGIVALAASVIGGRRRRAQIDELMTRVDELESRLSAEAESRQERPRTGPVAVAGVSDAMSRDELSADVLAGWTTHIGRMLSDGGRPRDLVDQVVIRIHRRIAEPVQPAGLAEELNVSLRTLERFLARSLECSPGQLILAVKMREARRMLESGEHLVGEVAHRLAFADAAHFSRRYRQFYHCPPSHHLVRAQGPTAA